jgi:hypothetical protein
MAEPTNEAPESGEQSAAPEPWAPEGVEMIGVGPRNGEPGERGSSAYDGDGATDERGPLSGVDYHSQGYELGTGITEHSREDAVRA